MAELISTLITATLRRIRDTGALASARNTVRDVLSGAQKSVNVGTFAQVESAGLTINAQQLVYQIATVLPRAGRILGITHESREIGFTSWSQLKNIDPEWFRRIGPRILTWSLIGRDILVIYPALNTADGVGVSYVITPTTIADETESNQIPDDETPLMVSVAEVILRIRARQLGGLAQEIKSIEASAQARRTEISERYPLGR